MTAAKLEKHIAQERELAETLEHYAGQWVAVREHRVIAHAASPQKLYEQLAGEVQNYRTFRVTSGAGVTLL
jgi:hypothetical protein